jgi:hypothetical protein
MRPYQPMRLGIPGSTAMVLSGGVCDGPWTTGDDIVNGTATAPATGTSVTMAHIAQHFMQAWSSALGETGGGGAP